MLLLKPTIEYRIQSVGDTVRVPPVKREPGANPGRYQSLCASEKSVLSAKAGHWETEKAKTPLVGRKGVSRKRMKP